MNLRTFVVFWVAIMLWGSVDEVHAVVQKTAPPKKKRKSAKKSYLITFRKGIDFCRQSEWEKAFSFFVKLKKKKRFQLSGDEQAHLYLYLGLIHANLLQKQSSRYAFQQALLLDPCIRLPRDLDLAPQLKQTFLSMRLNYQDSCIRRIKEALQNKINQKTSKLVGKKPKKVPEQKRLPSAGVRFAALLSFGSGSILLVSALIAGGLSVWDLNQREAQPYTPYGTSRYLSLQQRASQRAMAANVLFGSAGILLFTGLALHLSQWSHPFLFLGGALKSKEPSELDKKQFVHFYDWQSL